MRFLTALTAALLPFTALAAKKASPGRFEEYRQQQLSSGSSLKLTDDTYSTLTKAPRDYSVAVLLTALEARFGCQLCQEFNPEWNLLAKTWSKGDKKAESKVIFGTLDFTNGQRTFQSMQLQTAPVLLLFPPTSGPDSRPDGTPIRYDFTTGNNRAEPIHDWVARHLPSYPTPQFVRPFNWMKLIITTVSVLGGITLIAVAGPYVLPFLQNRNLWAALSLIAILLFTSGHMFNHIRKVPYISGDGKGGISYFAGGFQNQFGLETQIVAAMYGVLAFATISLALKVPRVADPKIQGIMILVWGGVMLAMYSFLLSVFRMKNGGYPFWLPPF